MHLTADPLLILTALVFLVPWARLATARAADIDAVFSAAGI